ncbi:penicillin acylase family protein [Nocardioides sp. SYSU D00038]|uniref:penicillin acylase family protein n=1 Tax=Nocardioides sp. SYSU D00038 TaxID=2812554 RepID=UPI0019681837|nr:penicillin acylase family protein [Nocardioides sp. SYSU D00038]
MTRRVTVLIAALCLVPLVPLAVVAGPSASGEPGAVGEAGPAVTSPAKPGRGKKYRAVVRVTRHGIPHVKAKDFGSLGFGSGYAAAAASLCTLADTLVTARGQRSRWFGPAARYDDQVSMDVTNLQVDAFVTDLRNRRVVERLLADPVRGPGRQARAMVGGYVAGINKYLRKVGGPAGVTDPACKNAGYLRTRATTLDLWYGVYLANLLASSGVFVGQMVDAAPPTLSDPGLPELPLKAADLSEAEREALRASLKPTAQFGSNATAVGGAATSTRRGMLLGNPHFPWRGRYHFTQQHLTIPGKYDVAGASLIGSPAINIGWNRSVAWSHTVSTAYRFTPYEYRRAGRLGYRTEKGVKQLERRVVKVTVRKADGSLGTVTEDLYRTAQGYVIDDPAQFMPWGPLSFWAIRDANAEHLRTIDTFLEMGKATSVRDLLRRQDREGGMPWVNTTAADRAGDVLYADHSVVPHVTDAMANRCMTVIGRIIDSVAGLPGLDGTRAGSACAWGTDPDAQRPGVFGPRNLPATFRRDWVMNANDSYWLPNPAQRLEGYAHIIGCERCARTMRTRMVARYVQDRLARGKETPASFRGHQHENRLRAAEVMRADGALDAVCAKTGQTDACAVLRRWDGRSNPGSRGTHIFEEFVERLPEKGIWKVPFDVADPLNTPRGLLTTNQGVVKAMSDAIASLRARRIPLNATWGSLQVAGDRGAPAIGLGGGEGDAVGNANTLSSRKPVQNRDRYKAVTYGSSHIQSIAFLDRGRVRADTILTYGQYEDPTSRWSSDQTRLFAAKRWVRFAFTDKQIRKQLVRRLVLSAPR